MAHEIEQHDDVILHKTPAWHGLGQLVDDAPTPTVALERIGADIEVECLPIVAVRHVERDGILTPTPMQIVSHKATYYKGRTTQLGIVGKDYVPIQNRELAEFCEALAEGDDKVLCETAGSIRNQAKVWFLLKGESFSVRGKDEVVPYICASNGHDGQTALRLTPTTVRVVCSNTLHMVIPRKEGGKLSMGGRPASFVCHHTRNIKERVEEAKAALALYGRALDSTREVIDALAAKDVTSDKVKQFFLQCYTHDFGPIPTEATTEQEENKMFAAREAFVKVAARFDSEREIAGTSFWNAMNAYTGWLQNEKLPNIKDVAVARERKMVSKLFGIDADRAHHALSIAVALAG